MTAAAQEEPVNAIPYPAEMRRAVPPLEGPVVLSLVSAREPDEDDQVGPVFGAAYMDMDPGDTGWWG